jgi:hypothetical protein
MGFLNVVIERELPLRNRIVLVDQPFSCTVHSSPRLRLFDDMTHNEAFKQSNIQSIDGVNIKDPRFLEIIKIRNSSRLKNTGAIGQWV